MKIGEIYEIFDRSRRWVVLQLNAIKFIGRSIAVNQFTARKIIISLIMHKRLSKISRI